MSMMTEARSQSASRTRLRRQLRVRARRTPGSRSAARRRRSTRPAGHRSAPHCAHHPHRAPWTLVRRWCAVHFPAARSACTFLIPHRDRRACGRGEGYRPSMRSALRPVDKLEVCIIVDNVLDLLSTVPQSVTPELPNLISAGGDRAVWVVQLLRSVGAVAPDPDLRRRRVAHRPLRRRPGGGHGARERAQAGPGLRRARRRRAFARPLGSRRRVGGRPRPNAGHLARFRRSFGRLRG